MDCRALEAAAVPRGQGGSYQAHMPARIAAARPKAVDRAHAEPILQLSCHPRRTLHASSSSRGGRRGAVPGIMRSAPGSRWSGSAGAPARDGERRRIMASKDPAAKEKKKPRKAKDTK